MAECAVKDLEVIYVPFGPATNLGLYVYALGLIVCLFVEAGAAVDDVHTTLRCVSRDDEGVVVGGKIVGWIFIKTV